MIMVAVLGFSMSAFALDEDVQPINANDLQVLIDTTIGADTYNVTAVGDTYIYCLENDEYMFSAQEANGKLYYSIRENNVIKSGNTNVVFTDNIDAYNQIKNLIDNNLLIFSEEIILGETNTAPFLVKKTLEQEIREELGESHGANLLMSKVYREGTGYLYHTKTIYVDEIDVFTFAARTTIDVFKTFYKLEIENVLDLIEFTQDVNGILKSIRDVNAGMYKVTEHNTKVARFDGVAEYYAGMTSVYDAYVGDTAVLDVLSGETTKDNIYDDGEAILDRGYESYIF